MTTRRDPLESAIKRNMVEELRQAGHYARRIEDRFTVGFPDMLVIIEKQPVMFIEVKIIKGDVFFPSPRQEIELKLLANTHTMPLLVGYQRGVYYITDRCHKINKSECFMSGSPYMSFAAALEDYLNE